MKNYEAEIEKGLTFARVMLAQELGDSKNSATSIAEVALATLALVAAREAHRKNAAVLKRSSVSTSEPTVATTRADAATPAIINFEEAVAALPSRRVSTSMATYSHAETSVPYLRLYRGS